LSFGQNTLGPILPVGPLPDSPCQPEASPASFPGEASVRATFPTGHQPRAEVRRIWIEESAGTRNMTIVVVKRMPQPIEAAKGTKN